MLTKIFLVNNLSFLLLCLCETLCDSNKQTDGPGLCFEPQWEALQPTRENFWSTTNFKEEP